jgi:soluble lytic murein transglycosylase-like protein
MVPDVPPSVPPYAQLDQEAVRCIAQASSRYQVPELLLHAIVRKEGGRKGLAVTNKNGSRDLGLAQINTVWLKELQEFNITEYQLKNDACVNLHVSGYVLRKYHNLKQDWFLTAVAYNIGPYNWTAERYRIGYRYAADVVRYWTELQDWVDRYNPTAPSANPAKRSQSQPLQFEAPTQ